MYAIWDNSSDKWVRTVFEDGIAGNGLLKIDVFCPFNDTEIERIKDQYKHPRYEIREVQIGEV